MAQPHFNRIKKVVYNQIINNRDFKCIPLLDSARGKIKSGHYGDKLLEVHKELNTLLDRWDIRAVGQLIDALPLKGTGIPRWIRNKQYVIDYNNSGEMDLIQKIYD